MYFARIVFCSFLIATATAKSSTSNPNAYDDPFGYYEDTGEDSLPPDQGDDATLPPRFITKPQVIVAKEGDSVLLDCKTENGEYYVSVWLKDKDMIAQGKIPLRTDLYTSYGNNSLLIKNMKLSSAGYYSCVITISDKENITLTHRVKLENAAEIKSLHAENNVTRLYSGETLKLTCEVDGKPMPTIKWYFDRNDENGAIEVQNEDHQSTGYRDTLIINGVNYKNNGTYRCFADNKISADHQSIVIEVFDKGRDAATSDSQISSGLRLLPSIMVLIATAILLNP